MRCEGVPSIEGTLSRSADTCLLFPQLCCTCRVASFRSSYLRVHHYFSWHLSLHHRSLTWGLIRERRNSSRPFPRLKHGLEPVNIFLPFLCVCVWGALRCSFLCAGVLSPWSLLIDHAIFVSVAIWQKCNFTRNFIRKIISRHIKIKTTRNVAISILILISKQVRLIFQAHGILKIQSH